MLLEILKVKIGLLFPFEENCSCNLRSGVSVNGQNIRMRKFGFETVSKIGTALWNNIPVELKNAESF